MIIDCSCRMAQWRFGSTDDLITELGEAEVVLKFDSER